MDARRARALKQRVESLAEAGVGALPKSGRRTRAVAGDGASGSARPLPPAADGVARSSGRSEAAITVGPADRNGALAVLQFIVGIWAHLNVRWRLRKLRFLVLTPDFHHWHHANEPAAINTNFSTLLPVWDLLFGTFRMPDGPGPQRYGVDEPVPSSIGAQLLYPFRRTGRRARRRGVHADAPTD